MAMTEETLHPPRRVLLFLPVSFEIFDLGDKCFCRLASVADRTVIHIYRSDRFPGVFSLTIRSLINIIEGDREPFAIHFKKFCTSS